MCCKLRGITVSKISDLMAKAPPKSLLKDKRMKIEEHRSLSFWLLKVLFWRSPNSHWKDWCWSWNSNTLATWCKELTHWKRPRCWERLKTGGEGDDRGWDGWTASPTQWTWVWASSTSWRWTRKPGVLQSMWSQRVGHDWVTELNRRSYSLRLYNPLELI